MKSPRRDFLKASAAGAIGAMFSSRSFSQTTMPATTQFHYVNKLPRWRGFNLLEKYVPQHRSEFRENDFDLIAEWGFDFARLPLSYLCWASEEKPREVDEKELRDIDRAIALGRARGIHVNLNLHRIPGYCVNPPKEARVIWTDEGALEDAAWTWAMFARRYKSIPSSQLSFDLINEPPDIPAEQYANVVRKLVAAIRAEDADRLIIADGLQFGGKPMFDLIDLNIAQSTRGYWPFHLTHWRAEWAENSTTWPTPTWPLTQVSGDGKIYLQDKSQFIREQLSPWKGLAACGVGVHVGEFGCHRFTPHDVTHAWMLDMLDAGAKPVSAGHYGICAGASACWIAGEATLNTKASAG